MTSAHKRYEGSYTDRCNETHIAGTCANTHACRIPNRHQQQQQSVQSNATEGNHMHMPGPCTRVHTIMQALLLATSRAREEREDCVDVHVSTCMRGASRLP